MSTHFTSACEVNEASHVRLTARGMYKNYNLHTDAGIHIVPNDVPLPEKVSSGSGWVLTQENSHNEWEGVGINAGWVDPSNNSTVAEIEAILNALEAIRRTHVGIFHPTNHISIYCDNDSVARIMKRSINCKINPDFASETIDKILQFRNLVHLDFKWERGHSTNAMNNVADKLASSARRDLVKFGAVEAFEMDLTLIKTLRRHELEDHFFTEHILNVERRQELCRTHASVELSFVIQTNHRGQREAEWFMLTGKNWTMGSFNLPKRRGVLELMHVASEVVGLYRTSEHFDNRAKVFLSMPAERSLLDDVAQAHRGKIRKFQSGKSKQALRTLTPMLDNIEVCFLQETMDFKGIASTIWDDSLKFKLIAN